MAEILQAKRQVNIHNIDLTQNGETNHLLDHRKSRKTRDQIDNILWIIEKTREFQKNIYFCFIDYAKAFDVWITTNCGQFLKRREYQTT